MGVINKTLLPLKLYNYFFFGSTACIFPIVPAYMMKLGVSPFQLSVIYFFMPFDGFLSRPITGKRRCMGLNGHTRMPLALD